MNARSLYFNRGESTSADAPTREDGLSDERILGIACHEADALDATRVNEIKDGAWKATTMMEDSALIRFARHILRAGHAARGDAEPVAWQLLRGDGSPADWIRLIPPIDNTEDYRPLYAHPPARGDEARDAERWRAWKPFVDRAARTVETWDGPMPHPFAKLVAQARAAIAAMTEREAE